MNAVISFFITLSVLLTSGYAAAEGYTPQTKPGDYIRAAFARADEGDRYVGESSADVWDENRAFTADDYSVVYKTPGQDFRVLTVDDIHLSDTGYRVLSSLLAESTLRNLVKEVQPDLILLPGDILCGDRDEYSVRRLTDMMESFGVPWAPVFGNHDDEANCDLNYLADIMMKGSHCLMKKGDALMGVGNYVVAVAEKTDNGDRLTEAFVMMDSHHNQPNELQQRWYQWVCGGIAAVSGGNAEVSVVMHIPLPEYQYACDEYLSGKKWAEGSYGTGEINEKICCERDAEDKPVQRGFFDVMKATGNTKYVFCAHDHMNDFSVDYEGIRLTYLMKLGMASGFQPGFDGGTVITVGDSGIRAITHKTKGLIGFRDVENITIG